MNLKEQIKNIYDFVNLEFDIEDKEELEGIKKGLSIDKIDTLDKMLKDYNKQVIKLKRAEQQRQAQKAYKKIGTNLKLEEYNKYAAIAEIDKISISEFCKKALESFIEPKKVLCEELPPKSDLDSFKAKYETLKGENEELKDKYLGINNLLSDLLKTQELEKEINSNNIELSTEQKQIKLSGDNERITNSITKKREEIEKLQDELKNFKSFSIFGFIFTFKIVRA